MSQATGICRLCGRNAILLDSHYIPQALYKLMRMESSDNPAPVIITARTSVQTSKQVTSPLLCASCEDRFNKYGEAWVIDHCFRRTGEFKLQDILKSARSEQRGEYFAAASIPAIAVEKIVYFVSSVFWRASAHSWKAGKDQLKGIRLGSRYEEEFRQFLLGQAAFPSNAVLIVTVSSNDTPNPSTSAPYGGRQETCHVYFFHIPGIHFCLLVGGKIDREYRDACIVRSPEHRIYWGDTNPLIQGYELTMVARAKPVGILGARYPRDSQAKVTV